MLRDLQNNTRRHVTYQRPQESSTRTRTLRGSLRFTFNFLKLIPACVERITISSERDY